MWRSNIFPLLPSILSPSSPFIVLIMEVIEVERIVLVSVGLSFVATQRKICNTLSAPYICEPLKGR